MRSTREIVVWSEAQDVLRRWMDGAIDSLTHLSDPRELGLAQGRLSALRDLMNLPSAILAAEEMEEADRANREAVRMSQDSKNWQHPFYVKGR